MNGYIKTLTVNFALQSAKLHLEGMPNDFLPQFGIDFLTILHQTMITSNKVLSFGYFTKNKELVGIIFATINRKEFMHRTIMRSGRFLLPLVLKKVLTKPILILNILETLSYGSKIANRPKAEVIVLSITKAQRNLGIGSKLILHLKKQFIKKGIRTFDVGTTSTNITANNFYKKHGGQYIKSFPIYGRKWHLYQYYL